MSEISINAQLLSRMFLAGAKNLEAKKDWINELNVFPVPDGDTGTNMTMTIMSAAKDVAALGEEPEMKALCKAMSSGSLKGARGNSGVILSQLLRGFCKVVRDEEKLDAVLICAAFQKATETAYKAVMKPKEGTILTVARACSDKATELIEADPTITLESLLNQCVEASREMLAKTPEMLPVLKEAGVVDSGGQGLIEILQGGLDIFMGKEIDLSLETPDAPAQAEDAESRYTYETSFVLVTDEALSEETLKEQKKYLSMIGDKITVKAYNLLVNFEVTTDDPGRIIRHMMQLGPITDIAINNRHLSKEQAAQKNEKAAKEAAAASEHKAVGFVSVAAGEGLEQIFKDLGVDVMIEGGQTMNPSTDDVIKAIEKANADTVFVLPNNKNIILAASQAASMVEDKKVIVIPTKTVPQGITALINYVPENTPEENEQAMFEEIGNVKTGQLTYAVRDTSIDGKEIHVGDMMGVGDSGILAVGKDLQETALEMIDCMADDDSELISIYYGTETTEDAANALADAIAEKYPDLDVEVNNGGQPVYYFIVSVE